MRKRKGAEPPSAPVDADVEAAARAAAQSIRDRFETEHPEPDALAEDPEFVAASEQLAAPDVPFETVARLGRAKPILAAMAHRAAARRDDVPADWVEWAFQQLKKAYAGEVRFLLEAIERHGEPPFVARVLARRDDDWAWGWLLATIGAFVERRVRAGERPGTSDFERYLDPADDLVADIVAELGGTLPQETTSEFERWRESRSQLHFFSSIGRVWAPADVPALTTVGGRRDVIDSLAAIVRRAGPRSALIVGEQGIGSPPSRARRCGGSRRAAGSSSSRPPRTSMPGGRSSASWRSGSASSRSTQAAGASSGSCPRSRTRSGRASTREARAACSTCCFRTSRAAS